ncbi:hypothetical protein BVX93_01775 [bacterium B13(2017)]|nr:hypothetical protein BVX93_01775 [bacterium B13(2017)]
MKTIPTTKSSYSTLLANIKREISEGLIRAQEAYDKEKIKTYWKVGQYIHNHFLQNKIQADFGKQIFNNLAQDLNIGNSLLYQMVQFYKTYPKYDISSNLKWSHYRVLATIRDDSKRKELENKVSNENLSKRRLEVLIKDFKQDFPNVNEVSFIKNIPKLKPVRGKRFHYKIFKNKFSDNYFVDYGFRIYKETDIKLFNGSFARGIKKGNDFSFVPTKVNKKELFTYQAFIAEVIDADTIWVIVDLGFRAWTKQKIRFNGIDAPERGTKDFEKSKQYLINKFKDVHFLMIKSFSADLYDRWLSDIYYIPNEHNPQVVSDNGIYINQELLDSGLVRPYDKNRNKFTFY